tara:strand:+ start:487 stop:951 length:465 start_codon:yes stop_codon:yes gene_type:complete
MPVVSQSQFRYVDNIVWVPTQSGAAAGGATVALQTSQSTGHIKLFVANTPVKVLDIQALVGAGVTTGTTLRPAYGAYTTLSTANLGTTLGAASATLSASAVTTLNIDCATSGDTELPPTIPAGAAVGVNIVTDATGTTTINGFLVRYRSYTTAI